MNGSSTAAIKAMSASTYTISSRVKPRSFPSLIFRAGHVFDGNVGRQTAAAFLAIRSIGQDIVRATVSGRAIHIGVVPGIVGDVATLEIWSVPGRRARCPAHQRHQAFRRRGKPARIEIEQIERAAEALQLDLRGLDFRFAEIIENARTDQAHDEADDGDHHQHLHERETLLARILTALIVRAPSGKPANMFRQSHDEPTLALSDKLRNRQKRCHDRYDQSPDDCTDGYDGKRPDDADNTIKAAL